MAIEQNILVAADTILLAENRVLLIRRKNPPFQGMWAFPGGFVDDLEDLVDAAVRELKEETCVEPSAEQLTQIGAFGKPGRDPRFQTVSIVFWAEVDKKPNAQAADDAAEIGWFALDQLLEMAFDHGNILSDFLKSKA